MLNMENIHIILCTYNRLYNIRKVLYSLNNQTVSKNIVLHLLNNNINMKNIIENQISKKYKFKIVITHYNNENNIFERFIYARKLISKLVNLKYLIFIDDDMIYQKNWVEDMYSLRKQEHYITWYVKLYDLRKENIDYSKSSIISYNDSTNNSKKNFRYGNYGGPGGSIIDIEIFRDEKFYKFPFENIKYMDDIWISYYLSHIKKWKIMRSFLPPIHLSSKHKTLYDTTKHEKNLFFKYLIKKGWRY